MSEDEEFHQNIRITIQLSGSGFKLDDLEQDLQRFIDEDTRESITHLSSSEISVQELADD